MKPDTRYIIIAVSIFTLSIIAEYISSTPLHAADNNRVRAKIGVQIQPAQKSAVSSGQMSGKMIRAKSKERLKAGDAVRLYVHTENSCYVYIIHTDGKSVDLLNITEQKIQSSTLIMPSAQAFYEIDGQSKMEKFTVICSPEQIKELSGMEKNNIDVSQWAAIETDLQAKSNALASKDDEELFSIDGNVTSIAGNVRGITNSIKNSSGANDDPFLKELQIFSGKGLVIKSYEFQIKK
ncbi:MAG: hypothetical protein HQK65_10670 [Desulfamplus sp.]|nr:hypothetical protein [Desulfamplus sp.]